MLPLLAAASEPVHHTDEHAAEKPAHAPAEEPAQAHEAEPVKHAEEHVAEKPAHAPAAEPVAEKPTGKLEARKPAAKEEPHAEVTKGESPKHLPRLELDGEVHAKKPAASGNAGAERLHKDAVSLMTLAAGMTDRGDYASADIAYRQIMDNRLNAPSDIADAVLGLAKMYRRQGAHTKAAAVYEKFLKLYPDDARVPDALLDLGRSQRAMGAYRAAINRFYNVINSTLKLPPESYEHYLLLAKTAQFEIAETHFETGNFTESAKFFDRLRLLDLAPEDRARAHFKSGCSLLNAGEAEKGAAKLSQYIDQWPDDVNVPEARYLLALTLRQLGRTEEALNITLALLRTESANAAADPKTWAYWQRRTGNQLANDFFQSGDTLSAVAIYEGLARLSDSPSWRLPIIYQTGLCYERLRQSARATQAYRDIIQTVAQPEGKDPVPAELTELAKMAEWRIGQLAWGDKTESQLTSFFSVTTPGPAKPAPAAPPAPAHDSDASPAAAPRAL